MTRWPLRARDVGVVVVVALACAACRAQEPAPAATAIVSATREPPPQPVLLTTSNGQPTSAAPTTRAACKDGAHFLEDLTIPDGTHVTAGQDLDKRWSVQNSGSCDWGPDYRLVHQGSSAIDGPAQVALYPARAGAEATWQVNLRAPQQAGEYQSRWQAQAPDGSLFGDEVFIVIVVDRPPVTGTPTTTGTH